MYVSVIGGDVATCTEDDCKKAEKIGAGIARMGAVLVCGGRGGVMEILQRSGVGRWDDRHFYRWTSTLVSG